MTQDEWERETLRQMMIGALALDPVIRDRALEVLQTLGQRPPVSGRKPTGDQREGRAA